MLEPQSSIIGVRKVAVSMALIFMPFFGSPGIAFATALQDANAGITAVVQGDNARAIEILTQALALSDGLTNADRGQVHYNRGLAQQRVGNLDAAIEDYTQAVRLSPTDSFSFFNRGTAYEAAGDMNCAVADYADAVRLNPTRREFNERFVATQGRGDGASCSTRIAEIAAAEVLAARRVPVPIIPNRRQVVRDNGADEVGPDEATQLAVEAPEPAPAEPELVAVAERPTVPPIEVAAAPLPVITEDLPEENQQDTNARTVAEAPQPLAPLDLPDETGVGSAPVTPEPVPPESVTPEPVTPEPVPTELASAQTADVTNQPPAETPAETVADAREANSPPAGPSPKAISNKRVIISSPLPAEDPAQLPLLVPLVPLVPVVPAVPLVSQVPPIPQIAQVPDVPATPAIGAAEPLPPGAVLGGGLGQPAETAEPSHVGGLRTNFGDDASPFAGDGECDDARFTGPGMAHTQLLKADVFHDATDCRFMFEAGLVVLRR